MTISTLTVSDTSETYAAAQYKTMKCFAHYVKSLRGHTSFNPQTILGLRRTRRAARPMRLASGVLARLWIGTVVILLFCVVRDIEVRQRGNFPDMF